MSVHYRQTLPAELLRQQSIERSGHGDYRDVHRKQRISFITGSWGAIAEIHRNFTNETPPIRY